MLSIFGHFVTQLCDIERWPQPREHREMPELAPEWAWRFSGLTGEAAVRGGPLPAEE